MKQIVVGLLMVAVVAGALTMGSAAMSTQAQGYGTLKPATYFAQPAPTMAPGPGAGGFTGGTMAKTIVLFNGRVTTPGVLTGSAVNILGGNRVDLQVVVDQPTTPNPVTVALQFSNDLVNWAEGPVILTENAADVNMMTPYTVMGQYVRMHATGSNNGAVTVRLIGVLK